jgi:hypothetical protein
MVKWTVRHDAVLERVKSYESWVCVFVWSDVEVKVY